MDIDSITVAVIIIIMSYNFNYFISSKKFLAYMLAIRAYNIDNLISIDAILSALWSCPK